MKKYVILGGGGVFSIHTASYLLRHADPERVVSVGRSPPRSEAFTLNVGRGDRRYSYHQIHVGFEHDRLFELLDEVRPDVVVNFAAQGEGAASWKYQWRYYDTNTTALARMCEDIARRDYLERWIQIGTSELYGSVDAPATEEFPLRPTTPYAVSKAAGDMHLLTVSRVLGFPMNIIRPSNAYAPGQQLHRVLPRAVVSGLTGRKLPLQGGGVARKSYMHARDLARAIHLVAEGAPLGKVYNVGPDEPITIRRLIEMTAQEMGLRLDELCEIVPPRVGEDSIYWLDSGAIKRDLGWQIEVGLEEGIAEMVAWGRRYIDELRDQPLDFVFRA